MKLRRLAVVPITLALAACASSAGSETANDTLPNESVDAISAPTDSGTPTPVRSFVSSVERATPDPSAPVEQLVSGFNETGFGLLQQQPADTNFVFSPTSIFHSLLMARGAADDTTASSITSGMSIPAGPEADAAWNVVDQQMSSWPTLALANRVWPRDDVEPDQAWLDLLSAQHGTDVEALPFAQDPEGSRDTINAWVADQTEELIPELLPDGFITPITSLVMTDAAYFEAEWALPFGKYGTVDSDFTLLDESTVPVELMLELEGTGGRGEGAGFVAAELPYAGDVFSMLLIVPDVGRFEEVRDDLDQAMLDEIDASFTPGPYELLVPRWDTSSTLDLLPFVTEIGAAPGSYPGISPASALTGAVHAADISVDETGTVAAAATALGFDESGPAEPELTVAADQPFLYLIRHEASGLVLFAGQLVDPS